MADDAEIEQLDYRPSSPAIATCFACARRYSGCRRRRPRSSPTSLLLPETPFHGLPSALAALLALLAILVVPGRRYTRLGYALRPNLLQVVRGWLFHTDTIVPLVRVQHIDVTRGPLEKVFGTATLVVHTAGTHNSIVVLPGLAPDKATAIRDEIRQRIRTDFE